MGRPLRILGEKQMRPYIEAHALQKVFLKMVSLRTRIMNSVQRIQM